jgi:hypothetical protein
MKAADHFKYDHGFPPAVAAVPPFALARLLLYSGIGHDQDLRVFKTCYFASPF